MSHQRAQDVALAARLDESDRPWADCMYQDVRYTKRGNRYVKLYRNRETFLKYEKKRTNVEQVWFDMREALRLDMCPNRFTEDEMVAAVTKLQQIREIEAELQAHPELFEKLPSGEWRMKGLD